MELKRKQQYDVLRANLMKGMLWIDSPDRTQEEINKWSPEINKMFRRNFISRKICIQFARAIRREFQYATINDRRRVERSH